MKRGPGTFVYEGGHYAIEHTPTIKRFTREEPVVDDDGEIAIDGNGNPIMRNVGGIVRDHKGNHMLGGKPKVERVEAEHFALWGQTFERGVPTYVGDPALALKLRCHGACRELGDDEIEAAPGDDEAVPPKRPRKGKRAAGDEGSSED